MRSPDDRGQALQVGAILLFGILIVGLSLYQATSVPAQNERVEFDSYLDANSDMQRLVGGIWTAAGDGYSTRTTIKTGTTYPSRVVAVNPGPPGNRLRTSDTGTIKITNATAVDGEENNTQTYWNGTTRPYNTTSVRFDTDYNQLQVPPIVYESGVMYRPPGQTGNNSIIVSDGTTINGKQITLITVAGELDVGGRTSTVVARPVSVHSRTVIVTGNNSRDENIRLTVPSSISNGTWENEIVNGEIDDGNVLRVEQNTTDSVDVILNGSRRFELRLAKVELRESTDSNQVGPTDPRYIVSITGDKQSLSQNQSTKLTVEVRDRYNNPKSGESVTFSTNDGTLKPDNVQTTNSEGQTSVEFEPGPGETGDLTVNATINDSSSNINTTQFTISVSSSGSGNGAGGDNPPTASIESIQDNSICNSPSGCPGNQGTAEFEINWNATDDNGINNVTIELINDDGDVVDDEFPSASGTSASGTVTLTDDGGYGDNYTIEVRVTDSSGQTNDPPASESDTADGTNP